MKLFFDTEFTELRADAQLLSIGMVDETGKMFYSEIENPKLLRTSPWIAENVISHFTKERTFPNYPMLRKQLEEFLGRYEQVELWSDCLAYDFVLFNQLWGGAMQVPKNIYYIPFDICTVFKLRGVDPDINREEFSGLTGVKHNALHDALVIKSCYEKLMATNGDKQ